MGGGRGWRVGPEEERRGRNRQHGRMARRNDTLLDAARLVGAILVEQNDEWAVQRAKYMTLDTKPASGDNDLFKLPSVAT